MTTRVSNTGAARGWRPAPQPSHIHVNTEALTALLRRMVERKDDDTVLGIHKIDLVGNQPVPTPWRGLGFHPTDVRTVLTQDELLLSSLAFACRVIERYAETGSIYVPQLDPDLQALDDVVVPYFVTEGLPEKRGLGGYHFAEVSEGEQLRIFNSHPRVARELLKRIGTNIEYGVQLPKEARLIAVSVLHGFLDVPKAPRSNDAHRDTLLVAISRRLHQVCGYIPGAAASTVREGEPPPVRGCMIAAAALHAFGEHIEPPRARKIQEGSAKLLAGMNNFRESFLLGLLPYGDDGSAHNFSSQSTGLQDRVSRALEFLSRRVTQRPA